MAAALFTLFPSAFAAPVKIMPLGDSITEGTPLVRIELANLKKDWAGALKATASLDVSRADILFMADKNDEAVALLETSKWADAPWHLAGIALNAKDYAGTAKHLVAAAKNWGNK